MCWRAAIVASPHVEAALPPVLVVPDIARAFVRGRLHCWQEFSATAGPAHAWAPSRRSPNGCNSMLSRPPDRRWWRRRRGGSGWLFSRLRPCEEPASNQA
jgi:hypothetical protein